MRERNKKVLRKGILAVLMASMLSLPQTNTKEISFYEKNISSFRNWEEGAYTFEVVTPNGGARRDTNFYTARKLRVLAVPMANYYSGRTYRCSGEWKSSYGHLYATYPLAKDGIEYILGSELDLSSSKYDLNDEEDGMYNVWRALTALQPKTGGYDLIAGFAPIPQMNGEIMGYTYEAPAVIVTQNQPDREATLSHEIAHTFGIGDEYPGGSLYPPVNMPPYSMTGRNMVTNKKASGTNPNIVGGQSVGLEESGSIIYAGQRPFDFKSNTTPGRLTSFMGWATGIDSSSLWVTGDMWNHMFKILTGISPTGLYPETGKAAEIATTDYTAADATEEGEEWEDSGDYGEDWNNDSDNGNDWNDGGESSGDWEEDDGSGWSDDVWDDEGWYDDEDDSYYAGVASQSCYKMTALSAAEKQKGIRVIRILGTLHKDGSFEETPLVYLRGESF